MKRPRAKPVGVYWRIAAGGIGRQPQFNVLSADYPEIENYRHVRVPKRTTFDELVVKLSDKGSIHLEQMDARTYYLGIGEEKRMITVKRDGTIVVGEMYR